MEKKNIILLIVLAIVIVVLGIVFLNKDSIFNGKKGEEISNFDECVKAGNPIMESYPRQCKAGGKTFTEDVEDWNTDGVSLAYIAEDGGYACFGCSKGLCVDPGPDVKFIDETSNRHCNLDFEVVENKEYVGNVGEACSVNEECETPMEYLVQSNCPFGSACINKVCRVTCPLAYHYPDPNINASVQYECLQDSDCDCSERGNRTLDCVCLDGNCFSVEE